MAAKHIIDPITRIEGHLRIEIEVDDNGLVEEASSSSTAFRGFENIMRGRDPKDVGMFASGSAASAPSITTSAASRRPRAPTA